MVENGHRASAAPSLLRVPFARRSGSGYGVEVMPMELLRQRDIDHSIFEAHRIEFHILFLVTAGHGVHMVDFTEHPVEPGMLVWIAPGQVHRFDAARALGGYLVLFQPEACGNQAPDRRWPTCCRLPDEDFELLTTLSRLIDSLGRRALSAPSDRLAWRLLSAVLDVWAGVATRPREAAHSPFSEAFEAFDALVDEHFARHRAVSWYARQLGVAEKTLSRWCRRATGLGAKAVIDQRVLLEAKRLLVHTDRSVDAIGERLGFSEATNFVKFFKRLEDETPQRFRRSYA